MLSNLTIKSIAARAVLAPIPRPLRTASGDIFAAPDGITGEWWYWFSWAERIGPVHAPEAAADAIVVAFQRVCLTSVPWPDT